MTTSADRRDDCDRMDLFKKEEENEAVEEVELEMHGVRYRGTRRRKNMSSRKRKDLSSKRKDWAKTDGGEKVSVRKQKMQKERRW